MQAIVIADHQEDREFLSYVLRHTGLSVARSGQPKLVANALPERPVDLMVLSLSAPQEALETIRLLRGASQAPLLVLIDQLTETIHCDLLDAGCDLVLRRPLSPRILTRYVRVFLQRAGAIPMSVLSSVEAGGLRLEPTTRQVHMPHQAPQQLTLLEFRLLYILMTNENRVIPIDMIVERVWGYEGAGNRELVRGLVRRLRRKIEQDPNQPSLIHNLPGIGYQFVTD